MANVQGTFYSATTQRRGVTPVSPPNAVDDPQDPLERVNPISFLSLTDTPSTYVGQALKGVRVNSVATALEFYTIPTVDVLGTVLTGYTVGSNTALANTDTILGAFQKVQGQINARISGTISAGQVAFGTGVNTIGGDSAFFWNNTSKIFSIIKASDGFTSILTRGLDPNFSLRSSQITSSNASGLALATLGLYYGDLLPNSLIRFHRGPSTTGGFISFSTNNNTERVRIISSGEFGIGTTSPTNTLDVNGTARIRTINNATGNFLTTSATGVIQQRTAAQVLTDIGAQATIAGTQTNGFVATIVAGVPTWAAASGGVGAGAGLSIDGGGDIQFGDDGVGIVNIGNETNFPSGVNFRYSDELISDIYNYATNNFTKTNILFSAGRYGDGITAGFERSFFIGGSESNAYLQIFYKEPTDDISNEIFIGCESTPNSSAGIKFRAVDLLTADDTSSILLERDNSTGAFSMVVTDDISEKGLEESADYSANKTDYSYVTKKMLDGVKFKLLDENISPTAFTSATFATILSGGILGTNSFDGAVDASYEGKIYIRSLSAGSYNFDLRFTIWGQNIDVPFTIGSITTDLIHEIEFKLIIQGGSFLLTGLTRFENTSINFGFDINPSMTTYTATGTSSLDILAQISGSGSPTLYPTSFVLKQVL